MNKFIPIVSVLGLMSLGCYALDLEGSSIRFGAQLISFFNLALFITSLISIKQFFWPGDDNRMPFHIFNIVFIILFYSVGLPFLVANREYYEGYANLTPLSVVGKFFLTLNISSFAQWLIVSSFFINILYIKRYRKTYYESGIAEADTDDKDEERPTAERTDAEEEILPE